MATKVIVVSTNKGGEGKTTNSINLSDHSAIIQNKKTLLLDLDPQSNASNNYLPMEKDPAYPEGKRPPIHPAYDPNTHKDWDGRSSIADLFWGNDVCPYPTRFSNLDICPGHAFKLLEAERVTRSEVIEKIHRHLQRFIKQLQDLNKYELIVIDTPPSKGPLTVAAIKSCTHMVIPSQMETDSIDGVYGIMQLWKQEALSRPASDPIELVGIVANKFREVSLHKQFYDSLRSNEITSRLLMDKKMKERIIYPELRVKDPVTNQTRSIFELDKKDKARLEVEEVCGEIMRRVYQHG